jgi:hypothetical protein
MFVLILDDKLLLESRQNLGGYALIGHLKVLIPDINQVDILFNKIMGYPAY